MEQHSVRGMELNTPNANYLLVVLTMPPRARQDRKVNTICNTFSICPSLMIGLWRFFVDCWGHLEIQLDKHTRHLTYQPVVLMTPGLDVNERTGHQHFSPLQLAAEVFQWTVGITTLNSTGREAQNDQAKKTEPIYIQIGTFLVSGILGIFTNMNRSVHINFWLWVHHLNTKWHRLWVQMIGSSKTSILTFQAPGSQAPGRVQWQRACYRDLAGARGLSLAVGWQWKDALVALVHLKRLQLANKNGWWLVGWLVGWLVTVIVIA